jgi:hypothetical protein
MAPGYGNEQTNATIGPPLGDAWFPGPPPAWLSAKPGWTCAPWLTRDRNSWIHIYN